MNNSGPKIVQVVKRFGLCGGMEEYVFRLSDSLTDLGYKVLVLCEKKVNLPNLCKVEIVQLGQGFSKPRWCSHIKFSREVDKWLRLNARGKHLIHSHERIFGHHITTIHSTLFNFSRKPSLPSVRKFFNEKLEEREINEDSVNFVVPVSKLIGEQIKHKFPQSVGKVAKPINPGINPIIFQKPKSADSESLKIGFIGEEWKRKGLPKVIEIWRTLTKKGVSCQLVIAGFPPTEKIGLTYDEIKKVTILGWLSDKTKFFSEIDILLHPAKREAYGMVIAEAASLGIPFICSTECGASTLAKGGYGKAVPETASIECWVEQVIRLIDRESSGKCYQRSWSQVAKEYAELYEKTTLSSKRRVTEQ